MLKNVMPDGKSVYQYCKDNRISYNSVYANIALGLSAEDAIEKAKALLEYREKREIIKAEIRAKNPGITPECINHRLSGRTPIDRIYIAGKAHSIVKYAINGVALRSLTTKNEYQRILCQFKAGEGTVEELYERVKNGRKQDAGNRR